MVPKIVSEHVKKTLSPDDQITQSKTRNGMQDIRRVEPAYADPVCRPPPKPTQIPTQIIFRKASDQDTWLIRKGHKYTFWSNFPTLRRSDIRIIPMTRCHIHGIDKGIDPNIRPEKHIIRPLGYTTTTCTHWVKRSISC